MEKKRSNFVSEHVCGGFLYLSLVLLSGVIFCNVAQAGTILISNSVDITLGGVTYIEGDLVEYDTVTGDASLFFSAAEAGFQSPDIDAVHVLSNGNIIFSMESDETYNEVKYRCGDLVEFNPVTKVASLYFDGSAVIHGGDSEDIDAMSLTPTGNLILSTSTSATLGYGTSWEVAFGNGDLVEYDPVTGMATLLFNGEELFKLGEDIDAVHFLANGNIILSTENDATLGDGEAWEITFEDGDLVLYDFTTGIASLYFDESEVGGGFDVDIDALFIIPEPATLVILGLGALALLRKRK